MLAGVLEDALEGDVMLVVSGFEEERLKKEADNREVRRED
jgi:hypothetical protein